MCKFALSLMLVFGFFNHSARAELVPELNVTTDYSASMHYTIGFNIDASNQFQGFYMEDTSNNLTQFPLSSATNGTYHTIFQVAGLQLVQMEILHEDSPKSATIQLKLLKNFMTGETFTADFQVKFDAQTGHYLIIDTRTGKAVNQAKVMTNYAIIPVGIASIETSDTN